MSSNKLEQVTNGQESTVKDAEATLQMPAFPDVSINGLPVPPPLDTKWIET